VAQPLYTSKILERHGLTGDVDYTVPDGYRLVIRDIAWWVAAPVASGTTQYAFGPAGGTFVWFVVDADTTVMHHEEARYVFNSGDTVTFHSDSSSDLLVSGYLLTIP
jgi:hypothetical protein